MKMPPIESEEEYELALARLAELLNAGRDASDPDERESLLEAIEEYEDEFLPIEPLSPRAERGKS
jgi:DNA-directed RNA polymerase subunit K/omega